MHHVPSELAKTRKFQPVVEPITTPFVRVTEDATVPYERVDESAPYESLELDAREIHRVELDLSTIAPIDDTLPFALEEPIAPIDRIEPSAPYELIEMRLSLPAVAQRLQVRPAPAPPRGNLRLSFAIAAVLISAFACGVGVVFAL